MQLREAVYAPNARAWMREVPAMQALALGLIDYVAIDIVPVVFGRGKPYFGTLAHGHVLLEDPDVVIQGEGVLHVRYPMQRGHERSPRVAPQGGTARSG